MRTRLVRFNCRLTVAVSLIAAGAGSLTAQQATISGTVRDASTATPIHGAVVSLGAADDAPLARTDANGSFTFRGVQDGEYQLVARRLGYEPARITVLVHEGLAPVSIPLRRIATLDTVRVRAARQGIFGVVGTARGLKPLPGAVIQVLGESSRRALADSAGHFFVPIKTPGTYVVRASVPAYEPRTISVTVRPDQGAEVAMLLDTASGRSTAVLAHAYDDLRIRLMQRALASAMIPRAELGQDARPRLIDVIRASPSFAKKAMRFGDEACVFVDGRPRAGLSINAIDPTAIEFVEVYGQGADKSATLLTRWPGGFPCAPTGHTRTTPGKDVVKWVVIWTAR